MSAADCATHKTHSPARAGLLGKAEIDHGGKGLRGALLISSASSESRKASVASGESRWTSAA